MARVAEKNILEGTDEEEDYPQSAKPSSLHDPVCEPVSLPSRLSELKQIT